MLTRRQAATAMGAGLLLPGVASARASRKPKVLVNLADMQPADPTLEQVATDRDKAHRVTAPVMLNGRGPYEFVVDTGANVYTGLWFPPNSRPSWDCRRRGEPRCMGSLVLNRLLWRWSSDWRSAGSRPPRLKTPLLTRGRLGADGLLGVDVLRNRRLAIDFRRNTITIYRANASTLGLSLSVKDSRLNQSGHSPDGTDYTIVPARMRFGQLIVVDADLGGVPVVAFLDSGSQNTVGNLQLYNKLKARPELLSVRPLNVQLTSATGQIANGELSRVPTLRLGGLGIADLSAVFADLHIFKLWDLADRPAILIGIDVMRYFEAIELDYGLRRVVLRTPPGALQRVR